MLPAGSPTPHPPDREPFVFEVLGPEHNPGDFAAWTSSIAHIRATPGFPLPDGWPDAEIPAEQNRQDLASHRERHEARLDFAWTVMEAATGTIVGCVYVKPDQPGRARAWSWVRADRAELDEPLRTQIASWLRDSWPIPVAYEGGGLPVIESATVTLRPQEEADIAVLGAFLDSPSLGRWFGRAAPVDLRSSPAGTTRSDIDGQAFTILVGGATAGWLLVSEEPHPDYREAALDIMLGPGFQGNGHGPAALRMAVSWLTDERGHHRITIDPAAANERAIAAYRSVGFREIGIARRSARAPDGGWEDSLLMDLLV